MSIKSACKNQETSDETTSSASWTDEKHSRYLNSMEASFVRAMFEDKPRPHRDTRLNRHLPDSSDSTLDSDSSSSVRGAKPVRNSTSGPRGRMNGGSEERSRRRPTSQPSNSSQDQVVPQLENRNVGANDEKEHHNVP